MTNETLLLVLNIVCGPVIFALIEYAKTKWTLNPALTTAVSVVLACVSTYALSLALAPGMTFEDILKTSLAVVGLSGIVNGGSKYLREAKAPTP